MTWLLPLPYQWVNGNLKLEFKIRHDIRNISVFTLRHCNCFIFFYILWLETCQGISHNVKIAPSEFKNAKTEKYLARALKSKPTGLTTFIRSNVQSSSGARLTFY